MATNPKDVHEDVEEVEYEITDDEEGQEEGTEQSADEGEQDNEPSTPSKPGKVKPSEEVKNLEHKSPETVAKSSAGLSPTKNPFPTFGGWTPETLSQIEFVIPSLGPKDESTNPKTRENRPEARYWKAPITFRYSSFTSEVLRFDNVHIPYNDRTGYGTDYVYLCLPGFVGDKFAEAGKSRRPTRVTEKSLVPDKQRWWKVANNVEELFGVVNKDNKKFYKKSLDTIFDQTKSGITATVSLKFLFKASTENREALKPTTAGTISIELERGFITATDVNIQMPVRIQRSKNKVAPAATSKDVASDSLMKRLQELGL